MPAVYATLLAVCVLAIGKVHHDTKRTARKEAISRLGDATALLASQLNGDHVGLLLGKYPGTGLLIKHTQDAWYYVMHDHLRRATERLGLESPLLLLAPDSAQRTLLTIATAEQRPDLRAPYHGDAAAILTALAQGERHLVLPGEDGLVAFNEVHDGAGRTAGIVLGRMSLAETEAAATSTLRQHALLAMVLFAMAALFLFGSVGRWLRRDEDLHAALRQRQDRVDDGIAYAAKIQRALAPGPDVYRELFEDAFVIDRPKDVVSGDFLWAHRVDDHVRYVAAADCTGHGLPGAMMATIGCALLNEVVPRNTHLEPAELLGLLNTRLLTTLHQQGRKRGAGDGMDLALCRIDRSRREILFAGAHRPLYWYHHGRISVINGDRKPIGGAHHEPDRRFTTHRLAYDPGDRIYLFSDGYVDQFGGPGRERFMSDRLRRLLQEHRHLSMQEQARLLEEAFLSWQGREEQVDDVSMLALAV